MTAGLYGCCVISGSEYRKLRASAQVVVLQGSHHSEIRTGIRICGQARRSRHSFCPGLPSRSLQCSNVSNLGTFGNVYKTPRIECIRNYHHPLLMILSSGSNVKSPQHPSTNEKKAL